MLQYCGPIFFRSSREAVPTNVFRNGTFGLVNTGRKKLLVTCAHVWTEFLAAKAEFPEAQLAVLLGQQIPIPISCEPIDVNTTLDLATFDMEPLLLSCGSRKFFPLFQRGVPVVKPKDILAVIGYLGEAREVSIYGANFGYEFTGISVADVSGPFVCVDLTKTKRYCDPDGTLIGPPESLGGMSGSPAYLLSRGCGLTLAGFVTSDALGILRLTHVRCLNEDGTVNATR